MSTSELARRTGLSRQTLHSLGGAGKRLPDLETVVKIAVELGVHPIKLLQLVFENYHLPAKHQRQLQERGDKSVFVADVTIPDGTLVAPGARFTKTWDVQNVGTVPWVGRVLRCMDDELKVYTRSAPGTQAAALAPLVAERLMPSAQEIKVPDTQPGEVVRLSVDFQAPAVPGTCVSYWKSFFADGSPCFAESVGLSCKVRVLALSASLADS